MPISNKPGFPVPPGTLVALSVIVKIKDIKYGVLSKYLFQRTKQHGSCKKTSGNDKFV